ncbi:MAG: DUF4012 domain-containing protein [Candidatus Buchananbacteria bacterium]
MASKKINLSGTKPSKKLKTKKVILATKGKTAEVKRLADPSLDLLHLLAKNGIDLGITPIISNKNLGGTQKKFAKPPKINKIKVLAATPRRSGKALPKEIKITFKVKQKKPIPSPHLLNLKKWLELSTAQKRSLLISKIIPEVKSELKTGKWLNFWFLENSPLLNWTKQALKSSPAIEVNSYLTSAKPNWTEKNLWIAEKPAKNIKSVAEEKLVTPLIIEDEAGEVGWRQNQLLTWPNIKQRIAFGELAPVFYTFKRVTVFLMVSFLILTPLLFFGYYQNLQVSRGQILGVSTKGVEQLMAAGQAASQFNLPLADQKFNDAKQAFGQAQEQLKQTLGIVGALAQWAPFANQIRSGQEILAAGQSIAEAGRYLSQGLNPLTTTASSTAKLPLTAKLRYLQNSAQLALAKISLAQKQVNEVSVKDVPADKQVAWQQLNNTLPSLITNLRSSSQALEIILNLLGETEPSRVLVLLQNNHELRATGGFVGSYALVDVKQGQVVKLEVPAGGSYDLKGGATKNITAPRALQMINPVWSFWDANWWPDFPASARNILWFYQKSGGPSVDYLLAFNVEMVAKLLGIIGPIQSGDQVINQANLVEVLQTASEAQRFVVGGKPKQMISDLTPQLIQKIIQSSPEQFLEIIALLQQALSQKDLMLFASDNLEQAKIIEANWGGELKSTAGDYLAVINTNIGGGKTDNAIKQEIRLQSKILPDNSVINTLIIKRQHQGLLGDHFTKDPNNSYLRIYVPAGAKLLLAQGFNPPAASEYEVSTVKTQDSEFLQAEKNAQIDPASGTAVYQEFGKTVFANWLRLKPGQSQEIILQYLLPFKLQAQKQSSGWFSSLKEFFQTDFSLVNYSLLVQRQAGSGLDQFFSRLVFPSQLKPYWYYPDSLTVLGQEINGQTVINQDFYSSINFLAPN